MGAGFAGSTKYSTNVNINTAGGNKKQGLASTIGLDPFANVAIRTNSYGTKRDYIFTMNQLGGVGAGQSQFNVAGTYTKKDGLAYKAPYEFKMRLF